MTVIETPVEQQKPAPMLLPEIRKLVKTDLDAVNQLIEKRLLSQITLICQVAQYITKSGGKRLRPLLVLLSARAFGYTGKHHIELAAVIEFVHTATLLHDDVVDTSKVRRGNTTANAIWGNAASILIGDFLYSRAFQMMTSVKNLRIMEALALATNIIAEGEVLQLVNRNDPNTTESSYMRVIRDKTAKLFEAAARLGAILCQSTPTQEQAIADFGLHLGIAYQIIDDVLDYSASTEQMGKNMGDDLAEGKPTLPLIYAMQKGSEAQIKLIRKTILQGGLTNLEAILDVIHATKALDYAINVAEQQAYKAITAIQIIPPSPYRQALESLVDFVITRKY